MRTRLWLAVALLAACATVAATAPAADAGNIWVLDGNQNCSAFSASGDFTEFTVRSSCPMGISLPGFAVDGHNAFFITNAPAGITINSAWTGPTDVTTGNLNTGLVVGDFWKNNATGQYAGSALAAGQKWFNTGLEGGGSDINSQFYGIQLTCTQGPVGECGWDTPAGQAAYFSVAEIELKGTETALPSVTGQGGLWASRSYVWNPPGHPWPLAVSASDVSGICSWAARIGNDPAQGGPAEPRDQTVWQQCPNPEPWLLRVDTRSPVPTAGKLTIALSATNAAGNTGSTTNTVSVDNDPVGVAFSTPNDPNPSVWVNHAVTVKAAAHAGPSGVAGMSCGADGGAAKAYRSAGVTVNGNGVHRVTCTASNKALGPQGQHNTGRGALAVKIDEAPPTAQFAPQSPGDPTQVVADTSDSESGVAGGSIRIARTGTSSWTTLPTSFDGSHLIARVDDARLRGAYTLRATACDAVGNCALTDEPIALPVRLATRSAVSFAKIQEPAKVVRKRVRVGFHLKRVRRHGRVATIKVGGHYKRVRLVIGVNKRCTQKRVRIGRRRWREVSACRRRTKLRIVHSRRVAHGKAATLHGLVLTSAGVPLANAPVSIFAAPDNGHHRFAFVSSATTDSSGAWTAKLPAGPSRIIRAQYRGSAVLLPSTGQASVNVPARIVVSVRPRRLPWSGTVRIRGHLAGGYVPRDGVALRLLIRLPGGARPYQPVPFRTDRHGRFVIRWSWGSGSGVATYPFAVATTAAESDYAFAASRSRWVPVTFGVAR